jgi:hypothetical protein
MTLHRKIGGIHWFSLGRLRIAFCIKAKPTTRIRVPDSDGIPDYITVKADNYHRRHTLESQIKAHVLKTYCAEERNMFGGF